MLEVIYIEFEDYSQLTYIDVDDYIELYLDGEIVGNVEVFTDRGNNDREYIVVNYEIIYLDTLERA